MTITIEAPELEASLTKAAADSNMSTDQYAAQILRRALMLNSKSGLDNPLHGSVLRYDAPFEAAVALNDWEVLADEQVPPIGEGALSGYGKFAHVLTSSDEFAARKEEEKARE